MSFSEVSFTEWLGLLIGVVSAFFGYLAWRTSRRSVRVSEEQLRLAREHAEKRPDLEVSEAELLEFLEAVEDPEDMQYYYGDHLPDKVLRVTIVNRGRASAQKISGWIYVDPGYLEPDDNFGEGTTDEDLVEGLAKVVVHSGPGFYLLANTNDVLTFDVALRVRRRGETRIRCEFTPLEGDSVETEFNLRI